MMVSAFYSLSPRVIFALLRDNVFYNRRREKCERVVTVIAYYR